jgi:formiminoglutamase
MELTDFLQPIDKAAMKLRQQGHPLLLNEAIKAYTTENGFPDIAGADIALVGVMEDRNAINNHGCAMAPDMVRKHLYQLFQGPFRTRVIDVGNIIPGNKVSDTYFAVKTVVTELIRNQVIPVIIGGSQDLTYANYQAYEALGQIINIVSVDSCFDIGVDKTASIDHRNYLSSILTHQPNFLFNYTNIGYQTYFVDQDAIELMEKLYFDTYRLGMVRKDLEEVEPIVRGADMLSFDISAIRQSEAPANMNASPNGFYGEEACQIVRYAALSDKLSSIGFYELNPALDNAGQTAHLVAQMIWYFLEGFYNRKKDLPDRITKKSADYLRYVVTIKDFKNEIVFYKSKKSDRWWMEVPCPASMQEKYERQLLVPCSYNEYLAACKDEIPEKWWQVYQKFM